MYRKEIVYMGIYKDGDRIGNAGFLKVENREDGSRLNLTLQNVPLAIKGRFPVRIHSGDDWRETDGITIQEGGGSWTENRRESAQRVQIQIMLPGGYLVEGRSREAAQTPMPNSRKNEEIVAAEERQELFAYDGRVSETEDKQGQVRRDIYDTQPRKIQDIREIADIELMQKPMYRETDIREIANIEPVNRETDVREVDHSLKTLKRETPDKICDSSAAYVSEDETRNTMKNTVPENNYFMREPPAAYSLKEDKWEQILDSYEKIHPYGDERVYVRLEPKDFIILQSKYQHLVNNSFLLHGFYNYRYVILGKENDYYLGVPGVFYEREKMVALMFGFESFECPGGVARAGEFGYYLRKVEL